MTREDLVKLGSQLRAPRVSEVIAALNEVIRFLQLARRGVGHGLCSSLLLQHFRRRAAPSLKF